MPIRSKRRSIISVGAITLLLLSACGGGQSPSTAQPAGDASGGGQAGSGGSNQGGGNSGGDGNSNGDGGGNGGGNGDGGGNGGGGNGSGTTDPRFALTPLAAPPLKNQAVYDKANGCFAIRDRASGKFLSAVSGSLAFDTDTAASASGFRLKATALGKFAFYDENERFMSMSTGNEAAINAGCASAQTAANTAGGAGSLLAIVAPNSNEVDQFTDATAGAGESGCNAVGMADIGAEFQLTNEPVNGSEWELDLPDAGLDGPDTSGYTITNTHYQNTLAVSTNAGANERFDFVARAGCAEYPEAELGATGTPFSGTLADGSVYGWAETHMHLGGSEALGGKLSYGRPFHKYGVFEALKNCSDDHGQGGERDALDPLVDPSKNTPEHDPVGWPTFNDWPSWGSQTHHQTYYIWVKRAWMSGLRFMVNHLVANEMLCNVWAEKEHDCNEMVSAKLQYDLTLAMQHYIDAQEGGPGKGFFRIVRSASEARSVIEDGKMAVVMGIELEKAFDCGEFLDVSECTREEIDQRVQLWYDLGLRAVFPIHIFDNAFGGAEIARFTKDPPIMNLYNQGNFVETGHYYDTVDCSEAEAIEHGEAETEDRDFFAQAARQYMGQELVYLGPDITGCKNNARNLTSIGDYFINKLIDYGMFIETDHSGPLARKRILDIAQARNIGIVSGHTGAISKARDSKRMMELDSMISHLSDDPAPIAIDFMQSYEQAWVEVHGSTDGLSTGFGADINGIHKQARPRDDVEEKPLVYPFKSWDGNVTFTKQRTGEREFDINVDGVAHYGLYADYIEDIRITPGGEDVLPYLFKSAEGYLRLWERLEAERDRAAAALNR